MDKFSRLFKILNCSENHCFSRDFGWFTVVDLDLVWRLNRRCCFEILDFVLFLNWFW